MVHRVKVKKNN